MSATLRFVPRFQKSSKSSKSSNQAMQPPICTEMPTSTKTKRVAAKEIESSSDEEEFNGFNNPETEDAESERDEEEEELERLVFGDAAGFRQRIKAFKTAEEEARGKELVVKDTDVDSGPGLETVQDADVCLRRCD